METLSIKALAIAATLFAALVGGYLPLWYERKRFGQAMLTQGYFFAKGIFLGAALMHLLPAAHEQFVLSNPGWEYPMIGLIVLLTIFVLHGIEHYSVNRLDRCDDRSSRVTIYLLIFTLSIHSIIEGAALGVGSSMTEIFIILIAVLAHKSADAFALVINMQRHGLKFPTMHPVMLVFACMTPFGIILGSFFRYISSMHDGGTLLAVIDAITAGTFIYIACIEQEDMPELVENSKSSMYELVSFGSGIALMALVAFWI